MLLTVIIPVYNEASTIEKTVASVLETPFEKQIVIVDDCSTDGTREIIQQLASPNI